MVIGIIILFILTAVSPMVFGITIRISNEKEPQLTTSQHVAQIDNHIWPMHKHDAQRTGRSLYDTSQNKGGEKWRYFIDQSLQKTPTIDQDGTLYTGTGLDELHAVYPNGTKKWSQELSAYYSRVPTIATDGTIYLGNFDKFHAFYPNGTLKWKFNEGDNFLSEPVIDSNGVVYSGADNGILYAIYPNGTKKWEYEALDYVWYPAIDHDDNIFYSGFYTNFLYCLNPNGTLKWKYKDIFIKDGPVICDDGTIYIVSNDLIALYPNGTVKWVADKWGYPSIAPDGTIILSGGGEYITALDSTDGSIIWKYQFVDPPHLCDRSYVAIGGDGSIFLAYSAYCDSVAFLVALNPDGSLKWETSLTTDVHPYDGLHVLSDPSIGSDGTVYITSWFFRGGTQYTSVGYIHAIGMDNPKVPEPPIITGPSKVKLFTEYEYTIKSDLPSGGDVYYWIDWDDELDDVDDNNFWIGPYPSGEEVILNHTWKFWRKHTIKVRAKGDDSLCSPWGALEVTMPRNRAYSNTLFYRLLESFPLLEKILLFHFI